MKKLAFISVFVVVIGICFTVSAFAEFYVIPVEKKDADLVPENIACDIEILGVKGTLIYEGIACDPIIPKTDQTDCWNSSGETIDCTDTGQDGEYELGITPAVAPSQTSPYTVPNWRGNRFTDNEDGTVTDNLTGLIWLKHASCFGLKTWTNALSDCNGLASSSCGLSDGSTAGDWRLPNFNELHSLVDPSGETLPPGHPFTNVGSLYWSSTTHESDPDGAWLVNMANGIVAPADSKGSTVFSWPVRSGN
ncbi:MAG: DUF1566 domain-containing protein [Deltaproteobacteria bacterium]|nr:DUF1566 domain-containing protein [Deltaproteobacteria bacterium]